MFLQLKFIGYFRATLCEAANNQRKIAMLPIVMKTETTKLGHSWRGSNVRNTRSMGSVGTTYQNIPGMIGNFDDILFNIQPYESQNSNQRKAAIAAQFILRCKFSTRTTTAAVMKFW
jgi:hypothetical protein